MQGNGRSEEEKTVARGLGWGRIGWRSIARTHKGSRWERGERKSVVVCRKKV